MPLTAKPINEEIRKEILALLDQQLSTSMSSPACGFARVSAFPLAPEEIERDQLFRFGADFVAGVGDEFGRDAAAARSRCRSGRAAAGTPGTNFCKKSAGSCVMRCSGLQGTNARVVVRCTNGVQTRRQLLRKEAERRSMAGATICINVLIFKLLFQWKGWWHGIC